MSSDRPLGLCPEAAPAAGPMSAPAPDAGAKVSAARAAASRRNGARSRGPRSAEGKARSAQNALKHGLCAEKVLMLSHEDPADLAALERALLAELAPAGAIQAVLARQVVSAAWRLRRVDRIEADLLFEHRWSDGGPGLSVIRDGNSSKALPTVLRYRAGALAEFLRAHKALRTLQAEAAAAGATPAAMSARSPAWAPAASANRNEPERPGKPRPLGAAPMPDRPRASAPPTAAAPGRDQPETGAGPGANPPAAPHAPTERTRETTPDQPLACQPPG